MSLSELTGAQQAVVTGLEANYCVTSGAGCGKTRVLVERYIRFLEEDLTLPLERLAAITFTENAAAEMRGRIRDACRAQVDRARQAGDRRTMDAWLERYWDVDVAPIDTIHAFCSALLRRYSIEAGVDPNFSPLDEVQAAFLVEDVVRRVFEEELSVVEAAPDPAADDLVRVLEHFSIDAARDLLAEMLREKREVLARVAGPIMARGDDEVLRDLRKAVNEKMFRLLRECAARPGFAEAVAALRGASGRPTDRREQLRGESLARIESLARARTAEIARQAAQWLAGNINLRGGSAKQWPSKETFDAAGQALAAVRDSLREVLGALPPFDETIERDHLALARALYGTARRAIAAYEAAKAAQSALDFEDLQIRARDLLRSEPRVLGECRKRFRAILVDELQDTNLLQFEIVDLLVSGPAARGKPAPLRPGALFGVGDPKQSIYRFRGAEFEVFQKAMDRVGPAGRKGLTESWRLHAGTAALVNHLFPPLMPDLYEPIEGKRQQANETVAECLHVLDPSGEGYRSEAGATAEAARLAARLREIVEKRAVAVWDDRRRAARPAGYGDVAMLFRRMNYLHIYERALEGERVPYYVVAGRGFFKQQEVLDVLHLLRVLDDPSDDLHLAGVLRSPFFAVSDEGLYHLRRMGRPLWGAVAAAAAAGHIGPEDRRGLRRAADLLPEWAAAKDRLGLAALVDHVAFESGYAASAVGRFGGERAYANLRQMAELARRFEREGLHALGDYIDYVTDFMKSEMRAEQAPVDAPGGDTVRLMTIHKAKGLEFPVVVLPDLNRPPLAPRDAYFIHPAAGLAVRMRDDEGGGRPSSALALARGDAADADRAEARRLFYVAVTRAKDYLIFASHQSYTPAAPESLRNLLFQGLGATEEPGDREAILPGGHRVRISAREAPAETARGGARRVGPRDLLDGGRVAWETLHERSEHAAKSAVQEALARAGPIALPASAVARVTATALAEYRRCPARYWWSEVLGVREPEPAAPAGAARARRPGGLTPLAWGTLSHRAMELAAAPDDVAAAVEGAVREAGLGPGPARDDVCRRLEASVRGFWAGPLGSRLARARQALREMPFLLRLDGAEIRGKIDLVFEGPDGPWEVVDYKTSELPPDAEEQAAAGYDLQLGLYALAAGRWIGRAVARWTVYFLDTGRAVEHEVASRDLARVEAGAREALAGIAAGRFRHGDAEQCEGCLYQRICGNRPA